jgi:hypothetical protein
LINTSVYQELAGPEPVIIVFSRILLGEVGR